MRRIKGPGIFLAQFIGDDPPLDTLDGLARWAGAMGYLGVQIPTTDSRIFDLELAAESDAYCDDVKGVLADAGVELTELSTHLQGQLIACHPVMDTLFDPFAPVEVRGRPAARQVWARDQLLLAARASRRLGLASHATFSGALLWPMFYPWPQRPAGLVDDGFHELGLRWRPILDAFDEAGVDVCYEIHPGEDLHDGATFERFLDEIGQHPRANILYDPSHLLLQQIDYLAFLDIYKARIRMMHVKDAEFQRNGRTGVYGGYLPWIERAGRFRSLGDGDIDFGGIFSRLAQYDFPGWAVVEWECCLKDAEVGAREGVEFVRRHIIETTARAFDDFAGSKPDRQKNRALLGLDGARET